MACFTAHTDARLTAVSNSPMMVLRMACSLLSLDDCHSQRMIVRMG